MNTGTSEEANDRTAEAALRSAPKRRVRLLGVATGAAVVVAVVGSTLVFHLRADAATAQSPSGIARAVPPVVSAAELEQRNGVRIAHVTLSAGGGLLDVRYQVVDPDKAVVLHETRPELVDETTNVVVDRLFMGHQHGGVFHAGQTYFFLFENPGNLVQRGSSVTVVLGRVRLPHVPVE
jgi:hypothetical protein